MNFLHRHWPHTPRLLWLITLLIMVSAVDPRPNTASAADQTAQAVRPEAATTNPLLTMPDLIVATPGATVTIPISFQAGGNAIAALVFSIDYDETWLSFDPTDANHDDIPDAISFSVPNAFVPSAMADLTDKNGELDFIIADLAPPLALLPDGVIATITLMVGRPPVPTAAEIKFASDPPVSSSDDRSHSMPTTAQDHPLMIAGPPNTVAVTANPTMILADGVSTSVIQASVRDSQNHPLVGTVVTFATTLGAITAQATTDASGIATATLTSLAIPGLATIRGAAGNVSGSTQVSFLASAPATISVTAMPSHLLADGASTMTIMALVRDKFDDPLPDLAVTFATTAGAINHLAATNTQGVASVTLTAPTQAGPAIVTAEVGAIRGSVSIEFNAGEPATLGLIASPASITLGESDNTSRITLILKDAFGNPIPNYHMQLGAALGTIAPQVTTDSAGVAQATFTASATPGVAVINAQAGTLSRQINLIIHAKLNSPTDPNHIFMPLIKAARP